MERVKTGIKGLDEMLGGGFMAQAANLVEGAPGTGKSTLGMQYIYNGITQFNEPGLILSFEEFPQQYYADAAKFGWDFPALEQAGKLKVILSSPEVSQIDLEKVGGTIETAVREMDVHRILIDSITQFRRLTKDQMELRNMEYRFINGLKREGLTSLFTFESSALLGESLEDNSSIAFIVDSVILLRYVEIESAIQKALFVLKMRGSDHAKDIRQFEITSKGLVVRDKFEGREGILSGNPRRMSDSFVKAFVKR